MRNTPRIPQSLLFALTLVAAPCTAAAQDGTASSRVGTRLGFSTERLARIDRLLQEAVDSNRIAGAVALVLRDGQVAYEKAVGWGDKESGRRMTTDAIFRIASQTKAITSVAILSLVEEGRLRLSDPVSRFIPSFAAPMVALQSDSGRNPVRARRAITIRDLLTHTAGISYGGEGRVSQRYQAKGLGPAAGWGWYTADKDEPICETMERLGTLPFVAQPGEEWVYGYNTDILGCVVERVSGQSLDEFIAARITVPLRMTDTRFFLPADQRQRLATVYASDSTGRAVRAPAGSRGQGHYVEGPRRSFSGGAGMLSTARDYARFLEMLRKRGVLDGARILTPHTVDLMTTNQVGTRFSTDGLGFGLGFQTTDRYGASGMTSVGSFAWSGAYASTYWVDPKEGLVAVFMIQQLPNRSDVVSKFGTLVYSALVESRP
jgi:CubicO group peptidase (beta-lactamase class C family)